MTILFAMVLFGGEILTLTFEYHGLMKDNLCTGYSPMEQIMTLSLSLSVYHAAIQTKI